MQSSEPANIPLHAMPPALAPEEQARADLYALIARLLLAAPDALLLSALAGADSLPSRQTDAPLDTAWEELILAASLMDAQAVQEEFGALFISVGTPAINPYASFYLSGFMMEKPLAALRADLVRLGLGRRPEVRESEDHLGALCEAMRLLIADTTGVAAAMRQPLQRQKEFFLTHIAPWYSRCLDDIRQAEGSNFYRPVADFAQAFFALEFQAFEMEDMQDDERGEHAWN